jgi:Flp pilus assembly protein TadG
MKREPQFSTGFEPAPHPTRRGRLGLWSRLRRMLRCEAGQTLVETVLGFSILMAAMFGIMEMAFAFYTYHYISEAAREGSRWAVVRGSTSCTNTPNLTHCNATATQIQNYVTNLGFPGINSSANMVVTATFLTATSSGTPPTTTWSACSTSTCNIPGNAVNVTVTYGFPIGVPKAPFRVMNFSSSSQMMITQ